MLARQEDALIAALKGHRDIKDRVRNVSSLPEVPSDELIEKYRLEAPALYVIPGRFEIRDGLMYPHFSVAAVASNVAGQAQGRKGDGIDLGVDQLMVLALRAIHEHRIADCTWLCTRGEMVDDDLFFSSGLTAMEIVFEGSGMEMPVDWGQDELDDFLHFHAEIDIEPHESKAVHEKWLEEPPDFSTTRPDADLDVQLPGADTP
ncbi:hypothetical protein [Variovorax paradoxus]|uniref:hypothetical protein n=1 Tax=Variovorax paradoxus TaxID=34073 RepID=UPI001ABC7308